MFFIFFCKKKAKTSNFSIYYTSAKSQIMDLPYHSMNANPSYYGREPSFYGREPSFYGREPSFYGRKPSFYGREPSFYGRKPSFYGRKPSFYGREPSFYGRDLRLYPLIPSTFNALDTLIINQLRKVTP